MKRRQQIALANDNVQRIGLLGLSNEVGGDGWVKLSPYGDHPKVREVVKDGQVIEEHFIQRLTLENAKAMAAAHNSFFGKVRNLRLGAPIFRGHADRHDVAKQEGIMLPGPARSREKTKLGMFAELQARPDGFYGLPVFNGEAPAAIENEGLKWFSPFWWSVPVGKQGNATIVEPVEFISAALTRNPNISGGHALANEDGDADSQPTNPQSPTMKKKIIDLLKKYGVALANEDDATVETNIDKLGELLEQRVGLANEKVTHTGRITALENEVITLKGQVKSETDARTALENEANETVLNLAIAEGRMAPSERAAKLAALKTGGATARTALLNEAPRYKVSPLTTAARKDGVDAKKSGMRPSQRLVSLANENLHTKKASTFEAAYALAKSEHPELVAEMEEAKETNEAK